MPTTFSKLRAALALALIGGSGPAFGQAPTFEFGKVPGSVSDLQLIYSRAPDNRAASVLIDNFNLSLFAGKGVPPFADRTLTFLVPTAGDGSDTRLRADFRASAGCTEDASGVVLARIGGISRVHDVTSKGAEEEQGFVESFELSWKSGTAIPVVIFASLQRGSAVDGGCQVTVDGVDLAEQAKTAPADGGATPP